MLHVIVCQWIRPPASHSKQQLLSGLTYHQIQVIQNLYLTGHICLGENKVESWCNLLQVKKKEVHTGSNHHFLSKNAKSHCSCLTVSDLPSQCLRISVFHHLSISLSVSKSQPWIAVSQNFGRKLSFALVWQTHKNFWKGSPYFIGCIVANAISHLWALWVCICCILLW